MLSQDMEAQMRKLILGIALLACVGFGVTLLTQTFDTSWNPNSPPDSWRIFHTDTTTWSIDDWHRDSARAPWGGHPTPFASLTYTATGDATPDSMMTPLIDCRGMRNIVLVCSTYFWRWSSNAYTARLAYSVDGGTTFPYTLHDYYQSSANGPVVESLALDNAANQESVVVAWVFSGNLAYINCWFVDDVEITGDSIPRWDVACRRILEPPNTMLPGPLTPTARYKNIGLSDFDTVFVACSLYDNTMAGLQYWEDTLYNLLAGSADKDTMFAPAYSIATGNYFIKFWCWADSDFVPTNDTLFKSFRVRNTRTIRNDDGSAASYRNWPLGHYGWGVEMNSDTFPVYFESLKVYLNSPVTPSNCRYQLALFNDDGTGQPGEMFYITPVQYAVPGSAGWNSVFLADSGRKMIRTAASGSFYLFYLQVGEPPESPSIGVDASRSSGIAYWQYRNGVFRPDSSAGDFMLRATMSLDAVTPPTTDLRLLGVEAPGYDFVQRPVGATTHPKLHIENFGTTDAADFAVTCTLTTGSSSTPVTIGIANLAAGADTLVDMGPWLPGDPGAYTINARVVPLVADDIPDNDAMTYTCDVIRPAYSGTSGLGYAWLDSDTTGGPVYNWLDTSAMTGHIGLGSEGRINIPTYFDFPYYDSTYNYVFVSANGWMGIGVNNPGGINDSMPRRIPDATEPNRSMYIYWDDLAMGPNYGSGSIWYGYGGNAPNRYCVILWKDVAREHAADTSDRMSFEVIIHENGMFQTQYQDVTCGDLNYDNGRSASIGLENSAGTDGLNYLYAMPPMSTATNDPGNRLASGRAIMFYRQLRDVAALDIIQPKGYMFRGQIFPIAKIQNYGTVRDSIRVFMRIGSSYAADTTIPGLGPGESTLVTFATQPWQAELGTYTAVCSTYFAGDVDSSNNVTSATVYITPWAQRENIPLGLRRRKVKNGALAFVPTEQKIYAMKGASTNEFWRYNIAAAQWETLPDMPTLPSGKKAQDGCDLTFDPDHGAAGRVWAIKGGGRPDFYYFDLATQTWHTWPEIRQPIINDRHGRLYYPPKRGAAMAYVGPGPLGAGPLGSVYMMPGNNTRFLWRYDIQSDSWSGVTRGNDTTLLDIPVDTLHKVNVRVGADMVYDGNSILYIMKGSNTCEVYGLNMNSVDWTDTLDATSFIGTPGGSGRRVKAGGSLTYQNGRLFALKGGNTVEFWRYLPTGDSWMRNTDIQYSFLGRRTKVKRGSALVAAESTLYCLKGSYGWEFWEYKPTGDTIESAPLLGRDGVMALSLNAGTGRYWLAVAPNPTRVGLTLSYNLPGAGDTRVRIYDASGKLVRNLLDAAMLGGRHELRWDGTDAQGRRVPSGVYFAALENGGARLAQKVIIEH